MKNKSYTKIISILIICLMLFSGCVSASAEVPPSVGYSVGNTFVIVDSTSNWDVVYCNKTKVMYVVSSGYENNGTFTLLVNPDGTPMIWEDSNA
jgi:PBP1b-binding outer membrane lipoprotein LpoB